MSKKVITIVGVVLFVVILVILVGIINRDLYTTSGYQLQIVGVGERIPGTPFVNRGCSDESTKKCHTVIVNPNTGDNVELFNANPDWEFGSRMKAAPLDCPLLRGIYSQDTKESGCTLKVVLVAVKRNGILVIGVNESAPATIKELRSFHYIFKFVVREILSGIESLLLVFLILVQNLLTMS